MTSNSVLLFYTKCTCIYQYQWILKRKCFFFTVDGYLRNFNLRYIQRQHDNNRRSLHFFGLTIESPYIALMLKLVVDCINSFFTKIELQYSYTRHCLSYFNVYKFLFMHICSLMILNSENKPVKVYLCVSFKMLYIILKVFFLTCPLSIRPSSDVRVIIRYLCSRGLCSAVPGANHITLYLGIKQDFTVSKIIALQI